MIPLLEVSGISKAFPGVQALTDVTFSLKAGTVNALCGENGAGKSTFVKIINGYHQPDTGYIKIDGEPVKFHHPKDARRHKIHMIFQELDYVPDFTVEQHLFLGEEPVNAFGKIKWGEIRKKTLALLESEQLPYKPTTRLKDLTVSDIQMLEILKAVSMDARILLMDEPTSAITEKEVSRLFNKIASLKKKGVGIIYISHKLDEIAQIADEISILRDGVLVETRPMSEMDRDTIINLMVGRKFENIYPPASVRTPGEYALEVTGLTQKPRFRDISFNVRKGEIVGVAGLVGAGRTEVARAIFGLDPFDSGSIKVNGREITVRNVSDSINSSIAMLSEDRKRYGLILERNVKENMTLAVLDKFFKGGRNRSGEEISVVEDVCGKMNVKTPSIRFLTKNLSGGNQQKIVFGKWLLKNQDVLILDEPTRGIDVGAKYEIYKLMQDLAAQGKAILMISSELPELIGVCDRMYVMNQGTISNDLQKSEFTQELIMQYATRGVKK